MGCGCGRVTFTQSARSLRQPVPSIPQSVPTTNFQAPSHSQSSDNSKIRQPSFSLPPTLPDSSFAGANIKCAHRSPAQSDQTRTEIKSLAHELTHELCPPPPPPEKKATVIVIYAARSRACARGPRTWESYDDAVPLKQSKKRGESEGRVSHEQKWICRVDCVDRQIALRRICSCAQHNFSELFSTRGQSPTHNPCRSTK